MKTLEALGSSCYRYSKRATTAKPLPWHSDRVLLSDMRRRVTLERGTVVGGFGLLRRCCSIMTVGWVLVTILISANPVKHDSEESSVDSLEVVPHAEYWPNACL